MLTSVPYGDSTESKYAETDKIDTTRNCRSENVMDDVLKRVQIKSTPEDPLAGLDLDEVTLPLRLCDRISSEISRCTTLKSKISSTNVHTRQEYEKIISERDEENLNLKERLHQCGEEIAALRKKVRFDQKNCGIDVPGELERS